MTTRAMVFRMMTLILQLGLVILVPVVSLTILGAWLGERFDADWIAIVLFVMGALGGGQAAWRLIRRMTHEWPVDPVSAQGLEEARREGFEEDQ